MTGIHADMVDIAMALKQLRSILPLAAGQNQLCAARRFTHLNILHFFLKQGRAPTHDDIPSELEWIAALQQLEAAGLIVLDSGSISIAYPFSAGDRGYHVTSVHGQVEAVCAFDALAISSMFRLPTRIDATCRLSEKAITIQQDGKKLETDSTVIAAIDWSAADNSQSCSASLCTEMLFIGNQVLADKWQAEHPAQRQLFTLQEAHSFISEFFLPLVTPR